MSVPRERQPWPMKWVVVAIVAAIVPYTYLTLHYRKPGKAFEPYHDMKDRANTLRLLNAGFQRIALESDRPAEPMPGIPAAPLYPARGGVPAALDGSLVEKPHLATDILTVRAAATISAMFSYPIELTCTQPNNEQQFGGADLYVRGEELVIVPEFESLGTGLLSRTRDNLIRLTVPAGALKPGSYHVTLVGGHLSKSWLLQVN